MAHLQNQFGLLPSDIETMVVQGHTRSSFSVKIKKSVCKFVLVIKNNCGRIEDTYSASQKTCHPTFVYNFGKCRSISKNTFTTEPGKKFETLLM